MSLSYNVSITDALNQISMNFWVLIREEAAPILMLKAPFSVRMRHIRLSPFHLVLVSHGEVKATKSLGWGQIKVRF